MLTEEQPLLAPWLKTFASAYKAAPVFTQRTDGPDPLSTWTFPPVFDPPEMIGGIGHFRHHPKMVEHVRRLGFDWEDVPGARMLTAPTPLTFNRLLARHGLPDCGYRLEYVREDARMMAIGPWLHRYLRGIVPIHVASAGYYRWRFSITHRVHLSTLVHDITVHALNYHLVPHHEITAMRERIEQALPERARAWSEEGAAGPLTLASFLDNDFNRYCYEVWCAAETPEEFPRLFSLPRHREQLVAALDTRIEETREGKGDVKSGDTAHMPQLAKISFQLR